MNCRDAEKSNGETASGQGEVQAEEEFARWLPRYEAAKERRDELAMKLRELYLSVRLGGRASAPRYREGRPGEPAR